MVHLSKFVQTESGKHIMSMLLGFGLASLFRVVCKGKECLIFQAPPIDEIKGNVYKHDGKCYKYEPMPTKCSTNKRIVSFA
jgi:hypothetical protein